MEPIRPDEDELRATRDGHPAGGPGRKKPDRPVKPPVNRGSDGGNGGGKKSSSTGLLWLLVLAVAVAGGAGWYQQSTRIAQMENQLEEADYWARQSKLALARFEGELSETGEDLQETGQSIAQRLNTQSERLDTADSEIRKLWGVANDRNKARLNDHEAQLERLDKALEQAVAERQALAATLRSELEGVESTLKEELEGLESSVEEEVVAVNGRVDSAESTLKQLQASVASVDDRIDARLKRFQREQSLTIDGLEGRISSLEKTTRALSGGQIEAIRSELASLKQTVSSIDASRAQLTSRLVRLSEEVSQLRSQSSAQ